ncbi:hypothetical protein MicB006_2075 [Micromonospora sp. B006]|nr:hypothetical protein MicB006_2075 [Micromonospora sp. B006]
MSVNSRVRDVTGALPYAQQLISAPTASGPAPTRRNPRPPSPEPDDHEVGRRQCGRIRGSTS